jgi:hypothetical protein
VKGVLAASLTANDLVFDQTPVTNNAGSMTIGDGVMLPLDGTVNNTGTIAVNSRGDGTDLQLIEHGITLQGGGQVALSDNSDNVTARPRMSRSPTSTIRLRVPARSAPGR